MLCQVHTHKKKKRKRGNKKRNEEKKQKRKKTASPKEGRKFQCIFAGLSCHVTCQQPCLEGLTPWQWRFRCTLRCSAGQFRARGGGPAVRTGQYGSSPAEVCTLQSGKEQPNVPWQSATCHALQQPANCFCLPGEPDPTFRPFSACSGLPVPQV